MEKATIYRAISAQGALTAGGVAVAVSLVFHDADPGRAFAGRWLVVLLIAAAANLDCLRRAAQMRGEPFVSAGMKLALRAMLPSFICAAVFTVIFIDFQRLLIVTWTIFYGLALLSTGHFAPRSISRLGWLFLACGLAFAAALASGEHLANFNIPSDCLMSATFGFFHLGYAACTWRRAEQRLVAEG